MPVERHTRDGLELAPQARRQIARVRGIRRAFGLRNARPRRRSPRSDAWAACRNAGRARDRRQTVWARCARARFRARTARRCPWDRRACARSARGNRRRAARHPRASCPPPATRRCAPARRARPQTRAIAAMSASTPISLLASISDTRSVSARSAALHACRRHPAGGVRLDQRDREAFLLELPAGVEHRLVLGARAHEVAAAGGAARRARHTQQREVVSLGGAGGEDDLARRGTDRAPPPARARLRPGRAPRAPAAWLAEAGLPCASRLVRHSRHGRGDARIHRGGGGVVEVDSAHERPALRRLLCTEVRKPRRMLTSFWSISQRWNSRRMRVIRWVPPVVRSRKSTSSMTSCRCA